MSYHFDCDDRLIEYAGEEDKWIPVEQAHSLHQLILNSKLVTVPQAGHLVIEKRPEILVREIEDFLNQPK